MGNKLQIWKMLSANGEIIPNENRFRIAEVYQTIDGYRTRLTHASFATLDEAQTFVRHSDSLDNNPL